MQGVERQLIEGRPIYELLGLDSEHLVPEHGRNLLIGCPPVSGTGPNKHIVQGAAKIYRLVR